MSHPRAFHWAVLAAFSCSSPFLEAQLRLPSILSSGMVLQRDSSPPLWGWAAENAIVEVQASWRDAPWKTRADASGRWRLRIETPGASGAQRITIRADREIVLEDVLVGEVWLASGQSNMEWALTGARDGANEAARARYPRLRFFEARNTVAAEPRADVEGRWMACTPETAADFSGVAYFFGRRLLEDLDVPIGLIESDWGGTVAEAWMSEGALAPWEEFAPALEQVRHLRENPDSNARAIEERRARWSAELDRADPGADPKTGWFGSAVDDSSWPTVSVPGILNGPEFDQFDGLIWLRHRFDVGALPTEGDVVLELGAVDDMDVTHVNGERVGGLQRPGVWNEPRRYVVPRRLLQERDNVLAIRVHDTGGAAGLSADRDAVRLVLPDGRDVRLAGMWRYRKSLAQNRTPRMPSLESLHPNVPSVLYNGMIAPIQPFGIRGAIWYQGESNRGRGLQYRSLLPGLIADWRRAFEIPDFPFLIVQIAPFAYADDRGEAAELREAQMFTAQRVPHSGLAITMDVGDPRDIHPARKQEVGDRLARLALRDTYGRSVGTPTGPLYRGASVEGAAMRVQCDFAGAGLSLAAGDPSGFTIAGRDGVFVPATARVEGSSVLVASERVPEPMAVRYAWGATDAPSLRNDVGLPASSFRTDDLPRSLQALPPRESIDLVLLGGDEVALNGIASQESTGARTSMIFHGAALASGGRPEVWQPFVSLRDAEGRRGLDVVVERTFASASERRVAIVEHVRAGSRFRGDWSVRDGAAGPDTTEMLGLATSAKESLVAMDANVRQRGLIWLGGTSDVGESAEAEEALLRSWVEHVRATLHDPELPIVLVGCGGGGSARQIGWSRVDRASPGGRARVIVIWSEADDASSPSLVAQTLHRAAHLLATTL